MKGLHLNYEGLHWIWTALARQGMDNSEVTRAIEEFEASDRMFDQEVPLMVTKKQVSALRLYMAQLKRPEATKALDDKCNLLFPTP